MLRVLRLSSELRGEVTAELVVETEAVIGEAAHLAVHTTMRRVFWSARRGICRTGLDVHDQRVAVAAHEKADGLALLVLAAVTGRDQHELAGGLQRLLDRTQHRAEEWAVQLRDQHADAFELRVASDCAIEFGW